MPLKLMWKISIAIIIIIVMCLRPNHYTLCHHTVSKDDDVICKYSGGKIDGYDVHCFGPTMTEIPDHLPKFLKKLSITDADISYIGKNSLDSYRENLRDITLSNLRYLKIIEDGTFANISNLRTLYISHAPQLKRLDGVLLGVTSSTFYSLRIVFTGLERVPDLYHLPSNNTMFLLDLDHNKIKELPKNSIKIIAEQVTINFNPYLERVEDYAFNNSQIAILSMHSNPRLTELSEKAFKGLSSLRLLDLSQTSIKNLPIDGLQDLETLKIEETYTLQTIPSIYDMINLRKARLTHSFHCCAFRYPAQHNPEKHAQFEETKKKICQNLQQFRVQGNVKKKRSAANEQIRYIRPSAKNSNTTYISANTLYNPGMEDVHPILNMTGNKRIYETDIKTVEWIRNDEDDDVDFIDESDEEYFHSKPINFTQNNASTDTYCGKTIFR